MPTSAIMSLIRAEFDFVRIDADLGDLQDYLRQAQRDVPSCRTALKRLRLVRCLLRQTLFDLDRDLTSALDR